MTERNLRSQPKYNRSMGVRERLEKFGELYEKKYGQARIMSALEIAERTYFDYLRRWKERPVDPQRIMLEAGPPKTRDQLAPEVLETLEDTPEGFERFFNRYSGLILQKHNRWFVEAAYDRETGKWKLRVVINVPPNHAKSTIFSVWMRIWRICQREDRDFRSIIVSETLDMAVQFAAEIAWELENNEKLIHEHGYFRGESNWLPASGKLRVAGSKLTRGYNVLARGRGTQIQSLRADEIVIDDPEGPDDVATLERSDGTERWVNNVIKSRLGPGGRTICIQTRQGLYDLSGRLTARVSSRREGERLWEHINFPALRNPDTGEGSLGDDSVALWDCEQNGHPHGDEYPDCCRPKQYLLDEVYDDIGSTAFAQTYQQDPLPPEARLVQMAWIIGPDNDTDPDRGCLDRERVWGPTNQTPKGHVRVVSLDPSGGRGYAAIIVADVLAGTTDFRCSVLELWRSKTGGLRKVLQELDRIAGEYHPRYFIPEMNLFKATEDMRFFDAWSKQHSIRVIPHSTNANKGKPGFGVESLAPDFEFGRIRLPYGDIESRSQSLLLIHEAVEYMVGVQGTTDDVLMALWFIKNNIRRLWAPHDGDKKPGRPKGVPPRLLGPNGQPRWRVA